MMKKILLTLVILTVNFTSQAQKKASFGIKAGANYSNITNTNFDSKTGLYIGGFLSIQLSKLYTLQPELTYSNQGANAKFSEDEDINVDYISVGVANKFFVMKDERFHFLVGISFDFDFDDNFVKFSNDGFDDDIFFLDIAIFGGLAYQFDFGLTFEVRYKQGTIGVFSDDFLSEDSSRLNSLFQFGMAYKFDLKK